MRQQLDGLAFIADAGRMMKHASNASGHGLLACHEISIGKGEVFALASVPRRCAIE
ncbi:hypothetical protein [Blastomonas sp. RAC04]|uniref:hypothetical protein n=1 Tax=Blastomonas sp. RAC04 TaxID=1842535 RepID=UPI001495D775|nr:hypothetical protein [Blastomonas sp. RAC04]